MEGDRIDTNKTY